MRPYLIAALLCFAAAPLLAAESLPARTTSAGGVTVKATPRTLSGAVWEFELVFDTHSQALNDDPAKQASLHGDGGAGGEIGFGERIGHRQQAPASPMHSARPLNRRARRIPAPARRARH